VANGRHIQANLVGDLLLKSECGNYLYLQGVLYSPSLNKNIISSHQLMQIKDYTVIMKDNYMEMQYYGTGLKIEMKPTENLYIFIGRRQPEHSLKYLELSTTKNYSRVLHKNIRRNTYFTNNNKILPLLPSSNSYSTIQQVTTDGTNGTVVRER
jgi:hypothetical protein